MSSKQITTSPTLKQFATLLNDDELIVTSKLGTATVSRVKFKQMEYPSQSDEQATFIRERVLQFYPVADRILGEMFEQCISDQAKAVSELLA
jgi:hypothetical protein